MPGTFENMMIAPTNAPIAIIRLKMARTRKLPLRSFASRSVWTYRTTW
ncbi:hypothetical protein I6A60_26645 [Frankia sp. AgB1.9]|nr:hypothetical protein [Frankia sp. AgW1.1]MBL7551413.1 hypothetical protein [Frankia sp. AgB1.9]MBL7622665.1 hypothetical protein [Frankia sp. AgB1.8]